MSTELISESPSMISEKEDLKNILNSLRQVVDAGKPISEADTKAHFIDRYLYVLGYHGLQDVQREYYIKNSKEYIDYLLKAGEEQIAVEAKALQVQLSDNHAAQLIQYAAVEGIEWCVLTNAKEIRVFNQYIRGDLKKKFVLKLNLLSLSEDFDALFDDLWLLSKEQISTGSLSGLTRRKLIEEEIKSLLSNENSTIIKNIRQEMKAKHNSIVTPNEIIEVGKSLLSGTIKKARKPFSSSKKAWVIESDDYKWVELRDLYTARLIAGELLLSASQYNKSFQAKLTPEGIVFNEILYASPSAAAVAATGKPCNGWNFWKFVDTDGNLKPLKHLRDKIPNLILSNTGFYKWKPNA